MPALSSGRPHKVGLLPSFPYALTQCETGDILSVAHQVLVDQNHQELPIFSKPPLHGAPTIHDTHTGTRGRAAGQIAPRVETTVTAQIVSAVSAFLLRLMQK